MNSIDFFISKLKTNPDYRDVVVYRIENQYGEGVFSGGGVSLISEDFFQRTVPAEKADFPIDIYNLLKNGYAMSACLNKADLEIYFGKENLDKLINNGFILVSKNALFVWESSDQVIAVDQECVEKFQKNIIFNK